MHSLPTIVAEMATRQGTRLNNADSAAIHAFTYLPEADIIAAAVVDGIGSTPEVSLLAETAAQVAVRVGARRTAILGILAAAELVAAPHLGDQDPDAVAVLAVAAPGCKTRLAWTGDCRAYGWDGTSLVQRTTDQTVGEYLRRQGMPADMTRVHDTWLRTSLGRSSAATVHQADVSDETILLTSDGIHDHVPHDVLVRLCREYHGDPEGLAGALVMEPSEDEHGYRDDATVVVLTQV